MDCFADAIMVDTFLDFDEQEQVEKFVSNLEDELYDFKGENSFKDLRELKAFLEKTLKEVNDVYRYNTDNKKNYPVSKDMILEEGITYNPTLLLFDEVGNVREKGKKILMDLAKKYFIGKKVCIKCSGVHNVVEVVKIKPPKKDDEVFIIIDSDKEEIPFEIRDWFEIEIEINFKED